MDGFFSALSASLVLLMLMSVGYFMGRLGWMTAAEKRFLSKFIVNIAVPCNCITGLLNNLDHDSLLQAGLMVASAMVGVAVTLALCLLLAKLLRLPRERWGCSWPWPPSPTPCSSACPCPPSSSGTCASHM